MTPASRPADPAWLPSALSVVVSNGVVALPYERLFGLAANALNPDAVAKVAAIKSRQERASGQKPISIIIPHIDAISEIAASFSASARGLAQKYWPGALTLIVPAADHLPRPLVSDRGLVGVRIAGPSPAALLCRRAGMPLTATSANRAGDPDALHHSALETLTGVDFTVEGTVPGPPGSTIVDVTTSPFKLLRQGSITLEDLN